jgi:RNA polymerase sigma factor (sigma-70 family)
MQTTRGLAAMTIEGDALASKRERYGSKCRREDIRRQTDGQVVRLATKGDQNAWEEIIRRFGSLVHRVAKRHGLTDSDAGDVAQVTWIRLMANVDRIRDPGRIAGWLATTARRESIRFAIGASRQHPYADPLADCGADEHDDLGSSADTDLLRRELDPVVENALSGIPSRYQRLLQLLTSDEGYTYDQVAHAMGVSIGSIGPMRMRALLLLRRQLDHSAMRSASAMTPRPTSTAPQDMDSDLPLLAASHCCSSS